jgi:hypothetical protein
LQQVQVRGALVQYLLQKMGIALPKPKDENDDANDPAAQAAVIEEAYKRPLVIKDMDAIKKWFWEDQPNKSSSEITGNQA